MERLIAFVRGGKPAAAIEHRKGMDHIHPLAWLILPALLLLPAPAAGAPEGKEPPGGKKSGEGQPAPEKEKQKKKGFSLSLPTKWPPGSSAGHWFVTIGIGTGTGYISGKVYDDNPKTPDVPDDGPEIRDGTTDTGPIVRWSAGYILKRGLGLALYARLQITNGNTTGYDRSFDAWIIGVRVLRLIYVKGQLNILPFLGFGYGMMRHIIRNTILPRGPSGEFYRASGKFDASLGLEFVYRFTPMFNFFVDLVGDVMFPSVSINLDAVIGLGLSY
jgi:hypothetical protein